MKASRLAVHTLTRVMAGVALACGALLASAAVPYPTRHTPAPQDLGAAALGKAPITVTVMLKLRNAAEMEKLVDAIYTPGGASFHRFITPAQFHERFGPSQATIAEATAYFAKAGLSVKVDAGRMLKVTGTPAALQKAFGVSLHQFEVASYGSMPAYRFHAAVGGTPRIASASVAANVSAIVGLSSRPHYVPNSMQASGKGQALQRGAQAPQAAAGNSPGHWTVTDLANYYNVSPLYAQGLHGEGKTLAIVTLAAFTPSDAFTYWSGLGLSVSPNRLSIVNVDGGPGAPSDASGSIETTLDVEQSGGLAPAANIVLYQAPNTDQAFVDAFAQAIDDNTAETISVSWGEWEWFDTQSSVNNPVRGGQTDVIQAFNNLFVQAALQGQSMFTAAGDAGAYEVNRFNPPPSYSQTLSVGAPGSSPWITTAGGTTLPGTQNYQLPDGSIYPITIPAEQAWGWDYLTGLCAVLGYDPISCGIFPGGGGGGVSSYNRVPSYQKGVPGIRVTEAGQSFVDYTVSPPVDYVDLPAGFAGRNVPDVSMNADPETGYVIDYTDDSGQLGAYTYEGGTSFVSPQLNGITTLIGQTIGGRVGLLNFPLYQLARHSGSYTGAHAPLRDITAGDNWFYSGVAGYDAATGVGTLDVANFARAMAILK
ncbi:MAG: S8 family serine peptidase [Proteobacteria bacterium]|nr:S8 family serine peptidase [Pseudomonadota bacterium]